MAVPPIMYNGALVHGSVQLSHQSPIIHVYYEKIWISRLSTCNGLPPLRSWVSALYQTSNHTVQYSTEEFFQLFYFILSLIYATYRDLHNYVLTTLVRCISRFIEDFVIIYNMYRVWYLSRIHLLTSYL